MTRADGAVVKRRTTAISGKSDRRILAAFLAFAFALSFLALAARALLF